LSISNETGTSRAGARYGAAFVRPEQNFVSQLQLRCLENEIIGLGTSKLRYPAMNSLTQDFFRPTGRSFCARREHTQAYATMCAKNATPAGGKKTS
jgi:hypothetical protein